MVEFICVVVAHVYIEHIEHIDILNVFKVTYKGKRSFIQYVRKIFRKTTIS